MKELSLKEHIPGAVVRSVEDLFELYRDMIFRLAFVRAKSTADAEDIVQEVFVRYIRSKPEFESGEHQKAWLIRTAINCGNSFLTSVWRRTISPLEDSTGAPDPLLHTAETQTDVYRHVLALPEKQRTAIHLFYYEGYKIEEIARLMAAGESAVKTWLMRGRITLRETLDEEDL